MTPEVSRLGDDLGDGVAGSWGGFTAMARSFGPRCQLFRNPFSDGRFWTECSQRGSSTKGDSERPAKGVCARLGACAVRVCVCVHVSGNLCVCVRVSQSRNLCCVCVCACVTDREPVLCVGACVRLGACAVRVCVFECIYTYKHTCIFMHIHKEFLER